ncbi:hypothetical protein F4775DRAFT_562899 [Biscogniauxia sp. FL1348]|nr:hypothetical protein F4775DRAFT_562899 [Biscogniauxia sp. FL1348]
MPTICLYGMYNSSFIVNTVLAMGGHRYFASTAAFILVKHHRRWRVVAAKLFWGDLSGRGIFFFFSFLLVRSFVLISFKGSWRTGINLILGLGGSTGQAHHHPSTYYYCLLCAHPRCDNL